MHDGEFKTEREILPIIVNNKEPLSSIFILNKIEDKAASVTVQDQYLFLVRQSRAMILLLDSTARDGVKGEFEEAKKNKIPIYTFIRDTTANRDPEVEAFINYIRDFVFTVYYSNIEDLIKKVEDTLLSIYDIKYPQIGKLDDNIEIISSYKNFELEVIKPELEKFICDAIIIGSWNTESDADKAIITEFTGEDINNWELKIKNTMHYHDKILHFNNGHWKVNDRKTIFLKYANRFLDSDLDKLKSIAVKVLREIDPMFELDPEKRYAASFYEKIPKYSKDIKHGIAEILALLTISEDKLTTCSSYKASKIVDSIIFELFNDSDWMLWASMNDLLPILAEASPEQFMNVVTNALNKSECPFDELYKQEGKGITGWNYMTGLLWALETLAWSEDYFTRSMLILAELAKHDPGGNFLNRPENSITTIFLPWLPHTLVSFSVRLNTLRIIQKKIPDIAFKVILHLLPNQFQVSHGTHKPHYRNPIDVKWKPNIKNVEFINHCSEYAKIALEIALTDKQYLLLLLNHIDNIPDKIFPDLLNYLISDNIVNAPEEDRMHIWEILNFTIHKHRKYINSKWAIDEELINQLQDTANKIRPNNPKYLYRQLFSKDDHFYFSEDDNWENYLKKIEDTRANALQEIYDNSGVNGILEFAFSVEDKYKIGISLWTIDDKNIKNIILPKLLDSTDDSQKQFVKGFITGCFSRERETWLNSFDFSTWDNAQVCSLLLNIAYDEKIWHKASSLLGDNINIFWEKIFESPHAMNGNLVFAIDSLMYYKRPLYAAEIIYVHYHRTKEFLKDKAMTALIFGITSDENKNNLDIYCISELITLIQNEKEVDQDKLFQIEWAYLSFLDIHYGKEPIILQKYLSTKPSFLLDVLKLLYRSEKKDETSNTVSEKNQAAADNAWELLNEWKRIPGMTDDNNFSESLLMDWFIKVKELCIEEGYFKIAIYHIGKVLFYTPKDLDGLWINKKVAQLLDEKEYDDLRSGYCNEAYNSRGVHFVDETGSEEKNIAELWRKRSKELENEGFTYFATSIRELATGYEYEAKRIISQFGTLYSNQEAKSDLQSNG